MLKWILNKILRKLPWFLFTILVIILFPYIYTIYLFASYFASPLCFSMLFNSDEHDIFNFFVKTGIGLNCKILDSHDRPLHYAVNKSDINTIILLIKNGADINAQNWHGETPLHKASKKEGWGNKEIMSTLINHGADVNIRDNKGQTPLHHASQKNSKEVIPVLIAHGAKVNAKDKKGQTPLHHASRRSHLDAVTLLIQKGADANSKNNIGMTPLHEASDYPYRDYREDYGTDHLDVILLLIEYGAKVNARSQLGSPLHLAVAHYKKKTKGKKIVSFLLNHGADINARDCYGKIPLHNAVYEKEISMSAEMAYANLRFNKNSDKKEKEKAMDKKMSSFLLKNGADINARDYEGKTLLHEAVEKKRINIISFLMKNGADVNIKDNKGQTSLMIAKNKGYSDILNMLKRVSQ